MTTNSDQIQWWNELAEKLNGYKGNYQTIYDSENGEEEFTELVKKWLKCYPRAIDIGCADGSFAAEISPYAEKVTAIDLSSAMLETARRAHTAPNLEFMAADARQLPFPDHSFDIAISRRGPVSLPGFLEEAVPGLQSRAGLSSR